MPTTRSPLHLAVDLDGAGHHPAAWREPGARPNELFDSAYWLDLATEAGRGLLDFVTLADGLAPQSARPGEPDARTDQVRGRLDAVLLAARLAPRVRSLGFVPAATVTHTEPFHLSKAVATLDYVSRGRAGLLAQVSGDAAEAAHFGRRDPASLADPALLDAEAGDWIEVLRRLWDSWEDDAEIRDTVSGRFVDRDKLHYVDFSGPHFSVKGPSITPRPPQGGPPVAVAARDESGLRLGGRSADVVFTAPRSDAQAAAAVGTVRAAQAEAGREHETVHVLGELVVYLDATASAAAERLARLDALDGSRQEEGPEVFTGTPAGLADLLLDWAQTGLTGYRLRPGVLAHDLSAITRGLVPALQRRGAFRAAYPGGDRTLRDLLGLPRPANRYTVRRALQAI
ncbi:alkanesulfonate monooxygenase SsuD/methylene tetrahydromethanopterin reductase-like flavin-dependent oxidoreductase (luciferase family) [Streptacidiphilus sp. MAP12-33]|uniref:LLM class flavin-dependent oxidoreductase n=1 Tax=Streptacidiphilus sp. MAP12-33 TaxID=3156266 RepID=UPI00351292A1